MGALQRGLVVKSFQILDDAAPGAHPNSDAGKFRRLNSDGGGQAGLIHWMTTAQPALSSSCCR